MAVTATFYGAYTLGYLQYIDVSNQHTLIARPHNTYQIAVASSWPGLAAIPADGRWAGPGLFPAQFSGVPGFASPGAFVLGSPGTARQPDRAMLAVLQIAGEREALALRRAEEERLAQEMDEARLAQAGWSEDDVALHRAGWADGDIRRRRRRQHLLRLREKRPR